MLPIAVPGLATALALHRRLRRLHALPHEHRRSSSSGHVVFTLPFMVRAVAAVLPASATCARSKKARRSLGASFAQRFLTIVLPNVRPGIVAGALMVLDAVDRRVQPDVDAAHAAHEDAAGRPGRQLRVDAHRDRQRLHVLFFVMIDAAARRDAVARRGGLAERDAAERRWRTVPRHDAMNTRL